MEAKDLMSPIKHIDIVMEDLQKLSSLDEDFIYEIESKAGFEYNIDMIVDVSVDAMQSWKKILQGRIENDMCCNQITFKELRELSGMNKTEFAKYFNIPYRSVQNWELGLRPCPPYLLELMEYKLNIEKAKGEV